MIRRSNKIIDEIIDLSQNGGKGSLLIKNLIPKSEMPHGRCFGIITLEQGAAIALHEHKQETEYFYILKGEGIAMGDGETTVAAGDLVSTGDGESHGIRNEKPEPLVFISLILYD